jgi:hypothetical protein
LDGIFSRCPPQVSLGVRPQKTMPTEEQIAERMPVWTALSEFYLDDDLCPADHQRIAFVLAQSRYSEEQLVGILRHEVYPACSLNLICVAGAWGTWGEDWIRERIAPRYDRRPRFYMPALNWGGIREHWEAVKGMISEQRSKQNGAQNAADGLRGAGEAGSSGTP